MNDKRKLTDESMRGAQAQALLDNPLFQDAFAAVNRAIWNELAKANIHDAEQIKALVLLQKANQKLYGVFANHVRTGQMADMQLRDLNARGE